MLSPPQRSTIFCGALLQETDAHMLGSTFKRSVVEDGCKIAHLPGLQHCKALQNCSPWQPEVSKLQEFPRHCPSKAAKLQTWQSKSAKLQALQALVAKQTWQGFSSNTANLHKTFHMPTCKGSNTAGLQNYSPCQPCQPAKVSTLQASHLLQGLPNYK